MIFKQLFFFFCIGVIHLGFSQKNQYLPSQKDSTPSKKYILIDTDTTVVDQILLDEVIVFQPLKFKSKEELRSYLILRRKTRKVWPYAVKAADRLEKLNNRLAKLDSKRKKRKYTKRIQKYIEGKFTDRLKKLTKTEGQILVKLMYRQTGETTFDLVKELKSGWRAFWYNTTASLFNISLKEKYNPLDVREDYLIEDILQRAFKDGILEKKPPAFELDYLNIVDAWQKKEKTNKISD